MNWQFLRSHPISWLSNKSAISFPTPMDASLILWRFVPVHHSPTNDLQARASLQQRLGVGGLVLTATSSCCICIRSKCGECKVRQLIGARTILKISQARIIWQAEPCYRGSVIHNKPLVVVNVFNNLADAWRIRICSFTESLNCSVHHVVRFSIYQEPEIAVLSGIFRPASS
jgi:hypothetical protein